MEILLAVAGWFMAIPLALIVYWLLYRPVIVTQEIIRSDTFHVVITNEGRSKVRIYAPFFIARREFHFFEPSANHGASDRGIRLEPHESVSYIYRGRREGLHDTESVLVPINGNARAVKLDDTVRQWLRQECRILGLHLNNYRAGDIRLEGIMPITDEWQEYTGPKSC